MIYASALQPLLTVLVGCLDRQDRDVLGYLVEENRVLRRQLQSRRVDAGPESDEEDRLELTRRVRKELLALNEVESVDLPAAPAAARSKAFGVDWQTLVVTLAASGGVLTTLIGTVQAWLTRQEKTSVTLEIGGDTWAITGASSEAQQRLVDDWIRRHNQ